jgi:hypothetical protein
MRRFTNPPPLLRAWRSARTAFFSTCRSLGPVLWLGWVGFLPTMPAVSAAPAAVAELDALIERLQADYPDRLGVGPEAGSLAGEVRERVSAVLFEAVPSSGDGASEEASRRETAVGRGLLVAADLYLAAGATKQALDALRQASLQGAPPAKAVALYRLGAYYFFRERYVPTEPRAVSASYYWGELIAKFPDSEWSRSVARPMRYLVYLAGSAAVDFEGTFQHGDEEVRVTSKRLTGKLILLNFWASSLPDQKDFETGLVKDMRSSIEEYPVLDGNIEVLGVNLDTSREVFEKAVLDWQIPWPQAHDGRGFETSLATQFAVPRLPHWCVITPDGKLAYLGGNKKAFYREATRAMKSLRVELESRQ